MWSLPAVVQMKIELPLFRQLIRLLHLTCLILAIEVFLSVQGHGEAISIGVRAGQQPFLCKYNRKPMTLEDFALDLVILQDLDATFNTSPYHASLKSWIRWVKSQFEEDFRLGISTFHDSTSGSCYHENRELSLTSDIEEALTAFDNLGWKASSGLKTTSSLGGAISVFEEPKFGWNYADLSASGKHQIRLVLIVTNKNLVVKREAASFSRPVSTSSKCDPTNGPNEEDVKLFMWQQNLHIVTMIDGDETLVNNWSKSGQGVDSNGGDYYTMLAERLDNMVFPMNDKVLRTFACETKRRQFQKVHRRNISCPGIPETYKLQDFAVDLLLFQDRDEKLKTPDLMDKIVPWLDWATDFFGEYRVGLGSFSDKEFNQCYQKDVQLSPYYTKDISNALKHLEWSSVDGKSPTMALSGAIDGMNDRSMNWENTGQPTSSKKVKVRLAVIVTNKRPALHGLRPTQPEWTGDPNSCMTHDAPTPETLRKYMLDHVYSILLLIVGEQDIVDFYNLIGKQSTAHGEEYQLIYAENVGKGFPYDDKLFDKTLCEVVKSKTLWIPTSTSTPKTSSKTETSSSITTVNGATEETTIPEEGGTRNLPIVVGVAAGGALAVLAAMILSAERLGKGKHELMMQGDEDWQNGNEDLNIEEHEI